MAVEPDECKGAIRDADKCTLNTETISADYCIIGGGTAGITIARELLKQHKTTKIKIVVLEGSCFNTPQPTSETQHHRYEDTVAQRLYRGAMDKDSEADADEFFNRGRIRCLGGTSNCWEGWTRPLAEHDFVRQSMPSYAWPAKARNDLLTGTFYQRAMDYCSIGTWAYANYANTKTQYEFWAAQAKNHGGNIIAPMKITEAHLESSIIIQMGQKSDGTKDGAWAFQKRWSLEGENPERIIVYRNAHVQSLSFNNGAVQGLLAKTLQYKENGENAKVGHPFIVMAKKYVLAASCIENARLLFLSGYNSSNALGKFLITHPRSPKAATFKKGNTAVPDDIQRFYSGINQIKLTEYPPNVFAVLTPALAWLNKGPRGDFRAWVQFDGSGGSVDLNFEQLPNINNTIVRNLDPKAKDIFGNDGALVKLKLYDSDTSQKALEEVGILLTAKGYATDFQPTGNKATLTGEHAMGSTRMWTSSDFGVVDENCQAYGCNNLFIAGGSVFPTGGWANPTLTILALAVRLADHIA